MNYAGPALEMNEQPADIQIAPGTVFETASKVLASVVLVFYSCGFLITSIHDFQYGFSEMNPFRPRILTAGAWFFLFLAVPFALVRKLATTEPYDKSGVKRIARFVNLSWAYIISCYLIQLSSHSIFRFDADEVSPAPHLEAWKIGLAVLAFIPLLIAFVKYAKKLPKWVETVWGCAHSERCVGSIQRLSQPREVPFERSDAVANGCRCGIRV